MSGSSRARWGAPRCRPEPRPEPTRQSSCATAAPRLAARAWRIGVEVYAALKAVLHDRGLATAVGDEGGFAPDLESSEVAIEAILEAAERAGHRERVAIALDPAMTEVFAGGRYRFEGRDLD